jgi:hypothetical protein
LERAGVVDRIGAGRFFDDTEDGLLAFHLQEGRGRPAGGKIMN